MKSLLHFLAIWVIYKNGFLFFPGPAEKKRDESPGPPDCKYPVPFSSAQNAPNPPSASTEFYAFSSKHCGNSQKAFHLPGGHTGISGIFLIYIVGQKNGGSILRMYACRRQAQLFSIRRGEHHPRPTITLLRPACFQ